jgi:hypothetical protein
MPEFDEPKPVFTMATETELLSLEYDSEVLWYFDEILEDDRLGYLLETPTLVTTIASFEVTKDDSVDAPIVSVRTEQIGLDPYAFAIQTSADPEQELSATANGDGSFSVYDTAIDHVYLLTGYETAKIAMDIIGVDTQLLEEKLTLCKNNRNAYLFQELIETSWAITVEEKGSSEDTFSIESKYFDEHRQVEAQALVFYKETTVAGTLFKEIIIQKIIPYPELESEEVLEFSIVFKDKELMTKTATQSIKASTRVENDPQTTSVVLDVLDPTILQEFIDAYEAVLITASTTQARL